ncbi:MAG: hypothetical protein K9J13_03150 [Saprospiraceae bacterium]|nr:hypothetical protein [Saprospiraceae bacterium]
MPLNFFNSFSLLFKLTILFVFLLLNNFVQAQEPEINNASDSIKVLSDTIVVDTIPKGSGFVLESKVEYKSFDSIHMDLKNQKAYLYGKAEIHYQEISLKAAYIELDFARNLVYAEGREDSTGNLEGKPEFMEGDQSFKSKTISYDFKTKKGLIQNVITQEGEGYLHGELVKKSSDGSSCISSGSYTTCNHEHPHYEIKFFKAKVIPNDKIVTGPAYLSIAGIPTPLFIPFGFFPNKKGQANGILIPTYGEAVNRGFFLENGGYYWGINDYMDLALRGDIYSRGSWAVKANSNYNVRYKFSGDVNLSYAVNLIGEKGQADYEKNTDFFVRWSHRQSPKARPNSQFSANVNAGSSKFNQFNPASTNDRLSNTFTSSVAYSTLIANKYNFSANFKHSQNTITKQMDLSLPELTFSVNRFYPLRKKSKVGELKWYDNISMSYVANARNDINTYDSLLLKSDFSDFKNGIKHSLPISSSVKVLKYATWTNSFTITERWYSSSIRKTWDNGAVFTPTDTTYGFIRTDTLNGFNATHDFNLSSSLNTRVYGMLQFKRGPVKALRHVVSPNLSFSWHPDFGEYKWGYYKYYQDKSGKAVQYSIYDRYIYQAPPSGKYGALNFGISNNLEMKVKSKKDTITGEKKVKIIENFTISSSYNMAKDSLKMAPVSLSGYTKLFKNLDIRYASVWDPYIINDSTGVNINKFEWNENKRLLRKNSNQWQLGLNLNLDSKSLKKKKKKKEDGESEDISKNEDDELELPNEVNAAKLNQVSNVDYDNPWSINLSYTMRYMNTYNFAEDKFKNEFIQTLNFSGDLSITKNWKIGVRSGYDFKNKGVSYTSVDIFRDLHCWEMHMNWIPIGTWKSYNLTIKVKAAVLQDLKLTKKKDWRDY